MQLADLVTFDIYSEKIGEIKFPKYYSEIFQRIFPRLFSGKFQKMMIEIGILSVLQR
jgi:hypothetical protein